MVLELNPRRIDAPVRPIGESFTGKDSQLDNAARELLKQIGPDEVNSGAARPQR